MGSDPIALPLLNLLRTQSDLNLVAVYTQPDRATGRGMKVAPNPIKQWAEDAGVPVRQPERCGKSESVLLKEMGVDLILVMAYGQILKKDLLAVPRLGVLNFHASLLPAYRGASPIATAVAAGETVSGVSLMRIVPRLDAGPVLDRMQVVIGPEATTIEVREAMSEACVPLWNSNWARIRDGHGEYQEQDESLVTYCRVLQKDDAWVDFRESAGAVHNRIRAMQPWPGACFGCGGIVFKIGAARTAPAVEGDAPGVLRVDQDRLVIGCGEGVIEILQLQKPGGRMMLIRDFLRGYRFPPAARAERREHYPLVSKTPFLRRN